MLNQRKERKRAPQEAQRKISLPIMKARSSRAPWARECEISNWDSGDQLGARLAILQVRNDESPLLAGKVSAAAPIPTASLPHRRSA